MKRTVIGCIACALLACLSLSCNQNNYGYSPTNTIIPPGNFRAFVSDPEYPNVTGGGGPALEIMNATSDLLSTSVVSLSGLTNNLASAGMMAVSPKRDRTLIFSPADNKLGVVSNSGPSLASTITLPGYTESMFVWTDNVSAFVASPNAPITGQPAGAVLRIDISTGVATAAIPVPAARYIVPSPNGNQILVFSDNSDFITLITPSLLGTTSQSNSQVPCTSVQVAACSVPITLDRPVWGVFNSSGTTAYIMNCGPQCGGAGVGPCLTTFNLCTSVAALDMTQNPPALLHTLDVPAATVGLIQGNSLYVAGTPALPADNSCSGTSPATAATICGRLTVIDVGSSTISTPVAITDGYHDRMQISNNGQLFVGSRTCTNINISNGEVRGCLTIANTTSGTITSSALTIPPDNGDVTGLAPITNRSVVYVCQGGNLRVYDTTTDKLETNPQQPNVIGQAVDVKLVDF